MINDIIIIIYDIKKQKQNKKHYTVGKNSQSKSLHTFFHIVS